MDITIKGEALSKDMTVTIYKTPKNFLIKFLNTSLTSISQDIGRFLMREIDETMYN